MVYLQTEQLGILIEIFKLVFHRSTSPHFKKTTRQIRVTQHGNKVWHRQNIRHVAYTRCKMPLREDDTTDEGCTAWQQGLIMAEYTSHCTYIIHYATISARIKQLGYTLKAPERHICTK